MGKDEFVLDLRISSGLSEVGGSLNEMSGIPAQAMSDIEEMRRPFTYRCPSIP
jgi:hypothetical protein